MPPLSNRRQSVRIAYCQKFVHSRLLRFCEDHQEQTREYANADVFVTAVGHDCLQRNTTRYSTPDKDITVDIGPGK